MIGHVTRIVKDSSEAEAILRVWRKRPNFMVGYIRPQPRDKESKLVAVFSCSSATLALAHSPAGRT